jgi:hypothetical protein
MYKQLLMLLLLVNSLLCPTPTLATTTGEAVDAAYEELKALIKTKCGPSDSIPNSMCIMGMNQQVLGN